MDRLHDGSTLNQAARNLLAGTTKGLPSKTAFYWSKLANRNFFYTLCAFSLSLVRLNIIVSAGESQVSTCIVRKVETVKRYRVGEKSA